MYVLRAQTQNFLWQWPTCDGNINRDNQTFWLGHKLSGVSLHLVSDCNHQTDGIEWAVYFGISWLYCSLAVARFFYNSIRSKTIHLLWIITKTVYNHGGHLSEAVSLFLLRHFLHFLSTIFPFFLINQTINPISGERMFRLMPKILKMESMIFELDRD